MSVFRCGGRRFPNLGPTLEAASPRLLLNSIFKLKRYFPAVANRWHVDLELFITTFAHRSYGY